MGGWRCICECRKSENLKKQETSIADIRAKITQLTLEVEELEREIIKDVNL